MTKIVGTLGPKSRSVEVISGCLNAGMSGNIVISAYLAYTMSFAGWFFMFSVWGLTCSCKI